MTVKVERKWGFKWIEIFFPKFTDGIRKVRNKQSECRGRLIHG
jgi:hypothetical protein